MEEKSVLKCNFCGHKFKRKIGKNTYEIACPKCREIDVEYLGQSSKRISNK